METVLDPTYIRPGIVAKGVVVSLTAIAVGLGVLLVCFGLSFFFHFDKPVISRTRRNARKARRDRREAGSHPRSAGEA